MSELHWQSALYQLRSRILSGDLPGGSKLRASHLSVDMGVSRTPISEALIKLEAEGLIVRDKSGYTVRTFGVAEVYDAIDLRGVLEGIAAQKAAERGAPPAILAEVKTTLAAMTEVISEGNIADYDQLNIDFHRQVVALSQSDILIREVERSYRLPFAAPSAFPTRRDNLERFRASLWVGQEHHRQIIAAIEAREGTRAFALMREHARLACQKIHTASSAARKTPQLALVRDAL